MYNKLRIIITTLAVFVVTACTQNQVGTAAGGAAGAGVGYAVSKNAWGTVIGGGAGALIGHELTS